MPPDRRRSRLRELGGFDTAYRRAGAEDRDFCDHWRAAGSRLVWRTDAVVEHRHAQSLSRFIDLNYRYDRGAYLYQRNRRMRGNGTMREDFGFHRTLPGRIWRRLGRPPGYFWSVQIGAAPLLWQAVNTAGFLAHVCEDRCSRTRRERSAARRRKHAACGRFTAHDGRPRRFLVGRLGRAPACDTMNLALSSRLGIRPAAPPPP
jgi:hypothetical protein